METDEITGGGCQRAGKERVGRDQSRGSTPASDITISLHEQLSVLLP